MEIRIVVLQRGWIVVGEYERDGLYGRVRNGAVIRNWGTTEGIGQLAAKGPRSDTVLDPFEDTEFLELTVVHNMKCNQESWRGKIRTVSIA